MRYSFAGVGMIMFGLISFVIVLVFQDITVNNEADYYSLKEAMEASMYEAIDIAYYRNTTTDETPGEIKIIEEKFVANFTRRFVNNTMGNSQGYTVEFYDIMEKPPKASIKIVNNTNGMVISDSFDVVNNLTGIIEANVTPAITDEKCDVGEKLTVGNHTRDYVVNLEVYPSNKYHYYKLNLDTVKNEIDDEVKNIWINKVEFGPSDIVSSMEISPAMQSASYLAQKAVDTTSDDVPVNGWTDVNNTDTNKVLRSSTCLGQNRFIPDFDMTIIDSDGSRYGSPIIRILKGIPDDANISMCTQILTYRITWEYSYCSS